MVLERQETKEAHPKTALTALECPGSGVICGLTGIPGVEEIELQVPGNQGS